ncbi:MAG: hypothetical protein WC708_00100 [Lentisphaeria bacterium]|jgi:hypothetical protein
MPPFAEIRSEVLESFLTKKRFRRTIQGAEVVYIRDSSRNPCVKMKVYTSITNGNSKARRCGDDAIRVCVIYDDGKKNVGIGKFTPVHRTTSEESILQRLLERMLEAAKFADNWIDHHLTAPPSGLRNNDFGDFNRKLREWRTTRGIQEELPFMKNPDYRALLDDELEIGRK